MSKSVSRWHLMPKSRHRGNQTYREQRRKELEAVKEMQRLVTIFVTGGRRGVRDVGST